MREVVAGVKGGVIPFHGNGAAARRYVEADRSGADEYYLGADNAIAEYVALDSKGEVTAARSLSPDEYEGWVDWRDPITGESMGTPRKPAEGTKGSPLFCEMTINSPKSLSVAAALHPEVSAALDAAQQDALGEIRHWLGQHSVTRVGPRDAREIVPIEQMQVVGIGHKTSRAGDPHRHIHMQIGTRIFAAGKWRALDTAALFKQQGAIRAMGTAVIAAHPQLAQTLAEHGLTLDPVSGEVAELEPFNAVMSKRSAQINRNLDRLEAEWETAHPGETPGPVVTARMQGTAWAHERPGKKPADLKNEQWWQQELADAGYDPESLGRRAVRHPIALGVLPVQEVASRALDRCAAASSAWTPHTVREQVTRIVTEAGMQAAPAELREFISEVSEVAVSDCFSIPPPGSATPEHVAHLTSLGVVAAETALRDQLTASVPSRQSKHPDVAEAARAAGLDAGQTTAAAAVASTDPLVIVAGAAGSGKTTMLRAAIEVAAEYGRSTRVVAPTKRAAQVAHDELGVPATSVAALVYAHGWRWNTDGVWTRLTRGDTDPMTGGVYTGPQPEAVLSRGERVIVDEAGMLDQDTAHALLTITAEAGATVALVGDRAQLPAVGRGGVLDMAAQIRGRTYDMSELHRFTDAEYAALTLAMCDRENPGAVFDQLAAMHLVTLHPDDDAAREHITENAHDGEAITVATNDEAAVLNERIRAGRVEAGEVNDTITTTGSDGLSIGAGDLIQTRRNDSDLGVANRQQWIVQQVTDNGTVYAREVGSGRKNPRTVALPAEYVGEHAHLSYAATAYGVQGATVGSSHTVLSEATSAAGVYVGMTRGRETNRLHVVATDMADVRAQFIDAMERDPADRGLDHATAQAAEAVRGLIADGPVRLVTEELARLDHETERAERAAERWEQITARFDAQHATHQAEDKDSAAVLRRAEDAAEQVRAEVTGPLTVQAKTDGAAYLDAVAEEAAASGRLATVGRFGKRKARAEQRTATVRIRTLRGQVSQEWGSTPANPDRLPEWAGQVANKRAGSDPRVTEAAQTVEAATADRDTMRKRHQQERTALLVSEYGAEHAQAARYGMRRTTNPRRQAHDAKNRAALLRSEADELRVLPITDAAQRIEAKRAEQEHARQRAAERARQLHNPFEHDTHRHDPHSEGPTRGL
ncbi:MULTISPECIES: MobF family relaxase [unclassified Kocuria]|uniref:MobF family relaxase n=1 Tax=unclassified Kocuria TaxID=2649579 RepID=UPI000F87EF10|nr:MULTISPECIES: MobF family relaxase [unclassified Kocuria]RUP84433.1 TrwC relaxase [Kocuria sp. HSID17590]RUQ11854.1 TrwC relaxase [Kocuria sp. HSID17582]